MDILFKSKKNNFLSYALFGLLGIFVLSIIFFSGYYNYGAESIGLYNVLRIIDGLPHITTLGSVPEMISPYGGIFPYLLGLPLKVIGLTDIVWVNFFAKAQVMAALLFCLIVLSKIDQNYISKVRKTNYVIYFVGIYLFLVFPFIAISYRPDFFAIAFELFGLKLFLDFLEDNKSSIKTLLFSSIAFALAPQFKITHIFILASCGLYLLIKKQYKNFFLMLISSTIFVAGFLFLGYLVFPKTYLEQVFLAANAGFISLSAINTMITNVINIIFFKFLPIHILFLIGLREYSKKSKHVLLFVLCILLTGLTGIAGQVKVGAYLNYFYIMILIESLFLASGLKAIYESSSELKKVFSVLAISSFLILSVDITKSLGTIYGNSYRQYPYKELKTYIKTNYPDATVYTPDSSIAVHFYSQTVLGPWVEFTYKFSKYIQRNYFEKINANLNNVEFELAIIPGSSCSSWKPKGIFNDQIKHLIVKKKQFKNLCVFTSQ